MSLGALTFLNPLLLLGLTALPLIWWLLRTVPPQPRQINFPPTRILVDIENRESSPAKTPWWLMLIRLLAAAMVIFALADPVMNPNRGETLGGSGPVVILVDNGWASAAQWPKRANVLNRLIDEAENAGRAVVIVPTARNARTVTLKIESPVAARSTAAAIEPMAFAPGRAAVTDALARTLKGQNEASLVWLSDGIDHDGTTAKFAARLKTIIGGGSFTLIELAAGQEALGVTAGLGPNGKLVATIKRTGGSARAGQLIALSARGERLSEAAFTLGAGDTSNKQTFDIPLELRNQVTRLEIAGERSAGAVSLLDGRSQWHRVGLISGESRELAQPLLAPLYYIEKALKPYSELVRSPDSNIVLGIENAFKQRSSILVLADIGTIAGDLGDQVRDWVEKGGILVRFAGPRLEKGGDDLLPTALRVGGRSLGGALSWSVPQPLAPFADDTPFVGLNVPADVLVKRQVLADPSRRKRDAKIWARLRDGTPLVTARRVGEGEIILFHVTANSDWSNLPLSGLFVQMLQRITSRGQLGGPVIDGGKKSTLVAADSGSKDGKTDSNDKQAAVVKGRILTPVQVLSGFGILKAPPATVEAISERAIYTSVPSSVHPPGYYGPAATPRALNIIGPKTVLKPLPTMPSGVETRVMESASETVLKPWLLALALALLFADVIAILMLQAGSNVINKSRKVATTAVFVLGLSAVFGLALVGGLMPHAALAQTSTQPGAKSPTLTDEQFILRATGKVTFGYVLTGDEATDRVSREGLTGLTKRLRRRTAVEPGDPAGVNIINDDIALFPILYWPVLARVQALPEKTLSKIDAYMKQGGMIIFDTRDFGQGLPMGFAMSRSGTTPLQRLLGKLDIPRLEPVPDGHVLTKSFYLLRDFPGRWAGGQLWVEADAGGSTDGRRQARRADGVSTILVTSNDFASAWALGDNGRPLYPTVPGGNRQRELAVRTGINIVMYALTGNYKADQVHIPALLERLGQ